MNSSEISLGSAADDGAPANGSEELFEPGGGVDPNAAGGVDANAAGGAAANGSPPGL